MSFDSWLSGDRTKLTVHGESVHFDCILACAFNEVRLLSMIINRAHEYPDGSHARCSRRVRNGDPGISGTKRKLPGRDKN